MWSRAPARVRAAVRSRPLVVAVAVLVVLVVGGVAVAVTGGFLDPGPSEEFAVLWESDTVRESEGNHHAPAATRIDGESLVFAPVSGRPDTDECGLFALDGATGGIRWQDGITPPNCTIHSVADPTVADYDGDGDREVLTTTTERVMTAYDPRSGDVELEYPLSTYGYTHPVVTDLVGDDRPEIVVVDARGNVSVARADGSTVWSHQFGAYTWGQPVVADVDGDGEPEVAVALGGTGELHLFERDGTPAWGTPVRFVDSITWMASAQADDDDAVELVVGTGRDGSVAMIDGGTDDGTDGVGDDTGTSSGSIVWERSLGSFAAVHAVADGDGDGTQEVYAVAQDGILHSLDARTGDSEWTTTLTDADTQMTPPPAYGDVDGDGDPDLLAVTNDGSVLLVDPATGEITARHDRDARTYSRPTLADLDGDGDAEALVMYGNGQVVAFDVETDG